MMDSAVLHCHKETTWQWDSGKIFDKRYKISLDYFYYYCSFSKILKKTDRLAYTDTKSTQIIFTPINRQLMPDKWKDLQLIPDL